MLVQGGAVQGGERTPVHWMQRGNGRDWSERPSSPVDSPPMSTRSASIPELPTQVVAHLVGGQSNVVATIDEDGRPETTFMSWVVARDGRHVALCVDTRSRSFANILARPEVALELMGDDIVCGVRGRARVEKTTMSSTPFPAALVVIDVDEVRDHAAPGTHFRGPSYHYDADKQHRHELEQRVYAELRGL